ncbi:MAG: hypothetical protein QNK23_08070 [Crocinitomicaceae bacterium]|nr:hypothetical protein [Crocinitomicaceae bacterium]
MSIKISTGKIYDSVEVIDTIFAMDSHKEGIWSGAADPDKAFAGVKDQLRKKCEQMGGHGIQDCQFEYRNAVQQGVFGAGKQVIEIFAYGTVVKAAGAI